MCPLLSEPWGRLAGGSKTPPLAGPPELDWFGGGSSPSKKAPGVIRCLLLMFNEYDVILRVSN